MQNSSKNMLIISMQKLLGTSKIISDNLKYLHHNIFSENFETDHIKLGEYYEKISDLEDMTAEMIILLGGNDINLGDALVKTVIPVIPYKQYNGTEAFVLSRTYFNTLVGVIEEFYDQLPPDCQSEMDPFTYWLRFEANYKIAKKLGM